MCGRYVLATDPEGLQARFGLRILTDQPYPRYNIAPGSQIAVIQADAQGNRQLAKMTWGIPPSYGSTLLINARSETVHQKPTFAGSFRNRRCLVPADGFYEWGNVNGRKEPHFVRRPDRQLFAMAGIFRPVTIPGGQQQMAVAILTVPANRAVRPIHSRMPAILYHECEETWLDPRASTHALLETLEPAADDELEAYQVGRKVNRGETEGQQLIAAAA